MKNLCCEEKLKRRDEKPYCKEKLKRRDKPKKDKSYYKSFL